MKTQRLNALANYVYWDNCLDFLLLLLLLSTLENVLYFRTCKCHFSIALGTFWPKHEYMQSFIVHWILQQSNKHGQSEIYCCLSLTFRATSYGGTHVDVYHTSFWLTKWPDAIRKVITRSSACAFVKWLDCADQAVMMNSTFWQP